MRPDALRTATTAAARKARRKLATRLSGGEQPNRKRMAEVGTATTRSLPPGTPADVMAVGDASKQAAPHR